MVVDHGLQPGSDEVAAAAAGTCADLGLAPIISVAVQVEGLGGPEAAARRARYGALNEAARNSGASAVLLAHTQDDQAETVLLGLARGSGPRAVAGMPRRNGVFRRPLLDVPRQVVHAAFPALPRWADPHNSDVRYARVRVRDTVLPVLEQHLGPGISAALARTAALSRAESDALDVWAQRLADSFVHTLATQVDVDARALRHEPAAVVARVMLIAARLAGAPSGALVAAHVNAMTGLVVDWHGQGACALPGGLIAERISGTVVLRRP